MEQYYDFLVLSLCIFHRKLSFFNQFEVYDEIRHGKHLK